MDLWHLKLTQDWFNNMGSICKKSADIHTYTWIFATHSLLSLDSRRKKRDKRKNKQKIFGITFFDLDIEVNIVKLLLKAFIIYILKIIIDILTLFLIQDNMTSSSHRHFLANKVGLSCCVRFVALLLFFYLNPKLYLLSKYNKHLTDCLGGKSHGIQPTFH